MEEETKVINTMDFGEENENFSINADAEIIIEENNKLKIELKRKNIKLLLDVMNKVCEKTKAKYFAAGTLLTYWNENEDSYPDNNTYQIRMFRKDYDAVTEYFTANEKKLSINVMPMYHSNKMLRNFTYAISKSLKEGNDKDSMSSTITFKLIPLDEVPADLEERKAFFDQVILKNRWLRGYSHDFINMYKGNRSISDKIKAKMASLFTYNDKFFKKQYDELSDIVKKYDGQDTGYYSRLEIRITRVEQKEDILPISSVDFFGTPMMVPSNIKMFSLPNAFDSVNHIKSIRTRALKRFDAFCEKNGLTYFAMVALLIESMQEESEENEEKNIWKVGMLRADYDKAIDLLSDVKTAEGLVLKCYEDDFITVPRKDFGFLCAEDDYPNVSDHNYQVILEVFDYLPNNIEEVPESLLQMKQMRNDFKHQVKKEHGLFLPTGNQSAMDLLNKLHETAKTLGKEDSTRVMRLVSGNGKAVAVKEILPVKKRDFRGFHLSVPNNEYLWYDKTTEGYSNAIKEEKLSLLKIFDQFCSDESIEYFAIADLLVGAVIYHDVIPGKASTGTYVGMIRPQYEKAIELLRKKQHDLGIVLTEYMDAEKRYPCPIKYISFPDKEYSQKIIYLSAFDKLPESFYLRKHFRDELKGLNQEYQEIINFGTGNTKRYTKLYTPEEIEQKTKEYAEMNVMELYRKIDTLSQKYNDDPQAYSYSRSAFSFSKIIEVEDIYPIQRIKYCDMEIPCPKDYSIWQPIQDENLLFQVQCIQKADKELMLELDRVCKQLGIGYFICGGTMLGYMRHKGFIPWDDDVDVAMLRADYDKFIKEAGPLFKEGMFLQTRESDPGMPYLFTKLRMDNTEYITRWNRDKNFHKGLCLDIFPFDYVPNNLKEREKFVIECQRLSAEHNLIANGQFGDVEDPFEPRNEEEKKLIDEEKAEIERFNNMSMAESQKRYLEVATRYNDKAEEMGLKTVASFLPTYTYIDINDLLPYQRGIFEDIEISVPKRPDIFLEMQYGDYMQLPPLHARVAHRLIRWSDGVNGADNEKKRDYFKKDNEKS